MTPRVTRFMAVGASGFVVQAAVLAALTAGAGWTIVPATLVAVEAAILTTYLCHERWTWRDRVQGGRLSRLGRFHLSNGLTSLVGNVAVTAVGVSVCHMGAVEANLAAVALLAGINYVTADRWIFSGRAVVSGLSLVAFSANPLQAASPGPETLRAWDRHVRHVEAELPRHEHDVPVDAPAGRTLDVAGGAIHEWRGSVLVRNATVGQLVDALLCPPDHPMQEDVIASKVLARDGDSLRLYLKLARRMIVTVTFDTEHDVSYDRRSAIFATGRSVAGRIAEVGGGNRGLLWRLNSYWRYRQVGRDVQVDVLSLSLSRDIPRLARPLAAPLIERVGRESMLRTLATVERAIEAATSQALPKAERTNRNGRGGQPGANALGQNVRTGSVTVDAERVHW